MGRYSRYSSGQAPRSNGADVQPKADPPQAENLLAYAFGVSAPKAHPPCLPSGRLWWGIKKQDMNNIYYIYVIQSIKYLNRYVGSTKKHQR